jgi:hypothetical protein
MSTLVERAKQAVADAKKKEKCLELAKQVERRMEDLNDASKTGNGSIAFGALFIVGGVAVGFFINPLGGFAMGCGGAAAIASDLDAKASAMNKATKELQRAVDDLEACLKK